MSDKRYYDGAPASGPDASGGGTASSASPPRPSGLRLLHQRTSLSLAHGPGRGWGYAGETSLYVVVADGGDGGAGDGKGGGGDGPAVRGGGPVELALHMRDGIAVDSLVVLAASSAPSGPVSLVPLPRSDYRYLHADPLSVVLTRPAGVHSVEDDGGSSSGDGGRRHEVDAHATRGIRGMTGSLRAASVASAMGELRVSVSPPEAEVKAEGGGGGSAACPTPEEAAECWRSDLDGAGGRAGEGTLGTMEAKMAEDAAEWRGRKRKDERIELISRMLGEASASASETKGKDESRRPPRAMKIVIRFSLRHGASSSLSLGGIHFVTPPPNSDDTHPPPHVYTVAGTPGDHQGVRTWLPTLDSSGPDHRPSHEVAVRVTAPGVEGLWAAGAGEDYGLNAAVSHPLLGRDADGTIFRPMAEEGPAAGEEDDGGMYGRCLDEARRAWHAVEGGIEEAIGTDHARFANGFFHGSGSAPGDGGDGGRASQSDAPAPGGADAEMPDAVGSSDAMRCDGGDEENDDVNEEDGVDMDMVQRIRAMGPRYVTSILTTYAWTPCPSRSLGFAVGPFVSLYDPEYYRLGPDDELEDEEDDADGSGGEGRADVETTARRLGEGIRQLYMAPGWEREWIHGEVTDEYIFGDGWASPPSRPDPTPARARELRLLEESVVRSTVGVPNRALSLMRDVLALPAYRTSSYTQIWIPGAQYSGSNPGGNPSACPEAAGCNPFLGGAIVDGSLLPPPGMRMPYHGGGRYLQFLQARCAVRGWTRAALPLGPDDEVGQGYLHAVVESFVMGLYERGHGAYGEGGGRGGYYYTKRYAISSGLNSGNLDFLPLVNVEEEEVGGIAVEERGKEHLWRSASNGTETHTSSLDEYVLGQLTTKDYVEALERDGLRTEKSVPLPSMGWQGSAQSATFLSRHGASSSALGCGALELVHPGGGQVYRAAKSVLLNRVYEGRAGLSHYTRVVRAAFMGAFLRDGGVTRVDLPEEKADASPGEDGGADDADDAGPPMRPPFVLCVDEIVKKRSLSHAIFTRALRVMAGPIHEGYLRGSLVDAGRENYDGKFERRLVAPEGFPNSYVRGASGLYLRVGAHVEAADGGQAASASQSAAAVKGIHLHVVVEPAVPEGAAAFGGPVTLRVIENEGQCREFVKTIPEDGSRADWGPIFLHARPVSTAKRQQAASGISEAPSAGGAAAAAAGGASAANGAAAAGASSAFSADHLHKDGYQALELVRITNLTPLLWIRVDPHGLYNGRISIFQQDACLAEQVFHDGDAAGQVEAMRALAERPLRVQVASRVTNIHDVPVSELPVRVLGDCLRGSVALHCDLPHNPAVRAQAALAIAQWQNNKAPESRDVVGGSSWLGLDLLLQYFKERHRSGADGAVLPANFRRLVLHKHIAGGAAGGDTTSDHGYQYLDTLGDVEERRNAIKFNDEVEIEEDEEYRVRSACVTAIASVRSQDGMTPGPVLTFLEDVLSSGDRAAVGSLLLPSEEDLLKKKQDQALNDEFPLGRRIVGPGDDDPSNVEYASYSLVADALLATCHVHVRIQGDDGDPATSAAAARPQAGASEHPIAPLMELCLSWLEWDLERHRIRARGGEPSRASTGAGESCRSSIATCAVTALCHMALLRQSTTLAGCSASSPRPGEKRRHETSDLDGPCTAQFYIDIFDDPLIGSDAVKAAAAQAVVCVCCAADRHEATSKEASGLLLSLEFLLDRIIDPSTSSGLRTTLAMLMMDASTGKVCSLQRAASFCSQGGLSQCGSRFANGPLGASAGSDNGSALLMTVSDSTYPAANAVNDGARRGLRLLKDSSKESSPYSNATIIRVAIFASKLWRTMNGEAVCENGGRPSIGVCAYDCHLRCSLVALWQWIWPKHCMQLMRSQSWHALRGTPQYSAMGLTRVLETTTKEKELGAREDEALAPLAAVVDAEVDRQLFRGEMAGQAYNYAHKPGANLADVGEPLPVLKKDVAWKMGGWVASTAHQRRAQGADGGSAVSKIRLSVVKNNST